MKYITKQPTTKPKLLQLQPEPRFKIPEKFLLVAGTESSRNRNANQNFDFVPVISIVFWHHKWRHKDSNDWNETEILEFRPEPEHITAQND